MKKILKAIVFGLILTTCQDDESLTSNREWTQVSNWGQESYARCIAVQGSTIFVGTDKDIFRSTNNGSTWTKLPLYSQVEHLNGLRSIHIKNNKLFGGEPLSGFIQSLDNGKTWNEVENSVQNSETVYSIGSNSDFVFIGTYGSGLFRSDDNGETWDNVFETEKTGEPIWNIAVDGNDILIFIPGKGLYHSPDNGITWTNITGDIDVQFGSGAIHIKAQTIFFGTNKFYKSNDLGGTWQEITSNDNGIEATASVWSIASNNNITYASTGAGVFYSKDIGLTWTKLPNKDNFFDQIFRLASNDNYIFGLDQYNVHRINKIEN